jgi:hypothetical protein
MNSNFFSISFLFYKYTYIFQITIKALKEEIDGFKAEISYLGSKEE